ncbi:MAG: uroporphyrinogen-III synthase [Thermoleophilia bacterium]|nr:uroporphyrinogen-III synthase [Thermoleophilia bacterium]
MTRPLIGITAARRSEEQSALVRAVGGEPMVGPCIGLEEPTPDPEILTGIDSALAAPLDIAVFLTGIGTMHLFQAVERAGRIGIFRAALGGARVLARGTKSRRALRRWGFDPTWVAEPPLSTAVAAHLLEQGVAGRRVLVQGVADDTGLADALRDGGGEVIEVRPYRLGVAGDRDARDLVRAAGSGRLAAITFTSPPAVAGFAARCDDLGLRPSDLGHVGCVTAAVGPTTAAAMRSCGLTVDVEPRVPRMGAMYQELGRHLGSVR